MATRKCKVCGKSFDTLSGLEDHHRAAHPGSRFVRPRSHVSRNALVVIIIVLFAASGAVGYLIYSQSIGNDPGPYGSLLGTPIPPSLYANLTTISASTLSEIGSSESGTTAPSPISASALLGPNVKPEVLYIGAEWCPFCAAERWSIIIALSRFGNFSGLSYMVSSARDVYPNTPTFSFVNSSYSSQYISFVAIEHEDRNKLTLQIPTTQEQSLWGQYTVGTNSIPFLYFDGQYYLSGAQYSPNVLSNLNWTEIASQLNNPTSQVAQLVDGSANQLVNTICNMLQAKLWPAPKSVCG